MGRTKEKRLRIAICDDEKYTVAHIKKLTEDFFASRRIDIAPIECFYDGTSLLDNSADIDLVLLDIDLPDINGVDVAERMMHDNRNVVVMMVTAHMQYLDKAMQCNVFRYISKPLDTDRLRENLLAAYQTACRCHGSVELRKDDAHVVIRKSDIVFIETNNRHTCAHTADDKYDSPLSLSQWTEELDFNCFVQTHQSYIVNLEYVASYSGAQIHFMNTQDTAMLSRRNSAAFTNSWLKYLEDMR